MNKDDVGRSGLQPSGSQASPEAPSGSSPSVSIPNAMHEALEAQEQAEDAWSSCEQCEGSGEWSHCEDCSPRFGRALVMRRAVLARPMIRLPPIEEEGERIAAETWRHPSGMYLWTDLVGAIQTALSDERARHAG